MQSTIQNDTLQFYAHIQSHSQSLAQGYQLITQYLLSSPTNRENTLLNLSNQHVSVITLVQRVYANEIFQNASITQHEKQQTRVFIVGLLVKELLKNEKMSKSLIERLFIFISTIQNVEKIDLWIALYEKALQQLMETNSPYIGYFILNIIREADDRINALSRHLIALILNTNMISQVEEKLEAIYYSIKSMAILTDTDPDTLQQYFEPFTASMISLVIQNMTKSVKAMKFCLKILTLMFGEFGVECQHQIATMISKTVFSLIQEYINYLNQKNDLTNYELDDEDDNSIEIVVYQMMELQTTLFQNQKIHNPDLTTYLSIISLCLSSPIQKQYLQNSDQYLAEIEDEGEKNIRNKAIFLIGELIQHPKIGKKCKKMIEKLVIEIIENSSNPQNVIRSFVQTYNLPAAFFKSKFIYEEVCFYLLFCFTEEIAFNRQKMCFWLGNKIKDGPADSIENILAVSILNKIMKSQSEADKKTYFVFLQQQASFYLQNIGMVIAIMRGLYDFSKPHLLKITSTPQDWAVPLVFIQSLVDYMSKNDSSQSQLGFLVLEFFDYLSKNEQNKSILGNIFNTNFQILLLKLYIRDGITSSIVVKLLTEIGNKQTISLVYQQIATGRAVDESLGLLFSGWMKENKISMSQKDLIRLIHVYSKNIDQIGDIISAYLEINLINNLDLVEMLNTNLNRKWLFSLIRQNKLIDVQKVFLDSVCKIINTSSQYQIEILLTLPYYLTLKNSVQALDVLRKENLLSKFLLHVLKYARLFQGNHLKVITSKFYLEVSKHQVSLVPKVIQLLDIYGKIQVDEWQDENIENDDNDIVGDAMAKCWRNTNQEIEEEFRKVFGQLCWETDSIKVNLNNLKRIE